MVCPPDHRHAETGTCYVRHSCRCAPCAAREAARSRKYEPDRKRRRIADGADAQIPAWPTQRRLQALAAIGYSNTAIEAASGIPRMYVGRIQNGYLESVRVKRTAARAHKAFVQLRYTPAPVTQASTSVRNRAARKGWVAAAAWDDIDRDEYPVEQGGGLYGKGDVSA